MSAGTARPRSIHLAYCLDGDQFAANRLRARDWSRQFIGSGWMSLLHELADSAGVEVVSGDVALQRVGSGRLAAANVLVVQDLKAGSAQALLALGAVPFLHLELESPLYAPRYYDHRQRWRRHFEHAIGFDGSTPLPDDGPLSSAHYRLAFPCHYRGEIEPLAPMSSRKFATIIASNKYRSSEVVLPDLLDFAAIVDFCRDIALRLVSPSYRIALASSLHPRRADYIAHFAANGALDLYGSGWDDLRRLPRRRRLRLRSALVSSYLGRCESKSDLLRAYQFALCFENIAAPHYLTEKIIDCFVAGTVPVYLGAEEVTGLIPREAYIDIRDFSCPADLLSHMQRIEPETLTEMALCGRRFIDTPVGRQHSYDFWAQLVMDTVRERALVDEGTSEESERANWTAHAC